MRVYIDISQSAFTHFSNEAKEHGVPVKTLISGEVEALYCNALEEKWREEDFEETLRESKRRIYMGIGAYDDIDGEDSRGGDCWDPGD